MQFSTGEADPSGASRGEHFVCTDCGHAVAIAGMPSTCPRCDGILDLVFAERSEREADSVETPGIWHWREWLPACAPENRVTLGEGLTPLLRCLRLGEALGLASIWVKNDAIMPTCSFKDRAVALATSLAKHYARPGLVLSSSGNAGASAAAYAARAGLPVVVLVPASTPKNKLAQILVTGARLVTVQGNTSDCCRLAKAAAGRFEWVNLTTTYYNPFGVDACATIAYEIAAVRPDVLLLPISSGPLLAGVMKGFARLKRLGLVERVPRPVAVQPSRCAPIVRAFQDGGAVVAWQHEHTVASALNDTLAGYERDGDYTLAWLRRYEGTAIAVSDAEIIDAIRRLATSEGIFVEPSAAASIAAVPRLIDTGWLGRADRVVAVTTGHGLKDVPDAVLPRMPDPIAPDEFALEHVFREAELSMGAAARALDLAQPRIRVEPRSHKARHPRPLSAPIHRHGDGR